MHKIEPATSGVIIESSVYFMLLVSLIMVKSVVAHGK